MNLRQWLGHRRSAAQRAPLVHSLIIMICATYLEVAVYMMVLWHPPMPEHYFGAALLGWACALIAYTRLKRRDEAAANA
jgi:hypothetical protein